MSEITPNMNEQAEAGRSTYTVTCIAPEGLGFGGGSISGEAASAEDRQTLHETATTAPDVLLSIEATDDGCGDGRCCGIISRFSPATTLTTTYGRSLQRPKVFGGGLVMTAASRIGLGYGRGRSLDEVYEDAISSLESNGIDFGAHTDDAASGDNSGCGALDKTPLILANASLYAEPIKSTLRSLGADAGFDNFDEAFDEIIANFSDTSDAARQEQFAGSHVMQEIRSLGKVIKQLVRPHNERLIILNTVAGTTVNQALFRRVTNDRAEAFATDLWRIDELADKQYPDEYERPRAALAEKVYTLATAATLTKGDLPVYLTTTT